MDLANLNTSELKDFDNVRLNEVEREIRMAITKARFDGVLDQSAATRNDKKKLKKSLARLLTVKNSSKK